MYSKLDFMILENINRHGEASLAQASGGDAGLEAGRIGCLRGRDGFRVIDGRLQSMRRRGLIRHVGGKWRACNAQR
jgi:hypothetical protein